MRKAIAALLVLAACSGGEAVDTPEFVTLTTSPVSATTTTLSSATTTVPPTTTVLPTTTVAPTTTTTLPDLTLEIAAASLEEVAEDLFDAWLDGDEDAYRVIDTQLQAVVTSTLATYAWRGGPEWLDEYLRLSEEGIDEFTSILSDDEWFPEGTFTRLAFIGVPGAPLTLYTGVYEVTDSWNDNPASNRDDATTIPGTYVVLDVEDCYWERLDSKGEIIDNNFISAAPRVEATIGSTDFAFNSEGCGRWVRIDRG